MQTIQPIQMKDASGTTLRLLEVENGEHGAISNMLRVMAQSPRTLEAYVQFARILGAGKIAPRVREQIALVVAQANDCEYSLERHAAMAGRLGVTNNEILGSCEGRASDSKAAAALKFARDLVNRSGDSSADDMRAAGFTDSEIIEVVGHVALNVFENYFNNVVRTDIDFLDAGAQTWPQSDSWRGRNVRADTQPHDSSRDKIMAGR